MACEYFMLIVKLEWELHDLSKMYCTSEGCVVENVPILYIKTAIILIIYVIFDRYETSKKKKKRVMFYVLILFFSPPTYSNKYDGFFFAFINSVIYYGEHSYNDKIYSRVLYLLNFDGCVFMFMF